MGWTKAPPGENFCVVVAKTYEVEEEVMDIEIDPVEDMGDEPGNDSFSREAECFEDEHEMEAGFTSSVSLGQGEYRDRRSNRESTGGSGRGFWGQIARLFSRVSSHESQDGIEITDAEPKLKPSGNTSGDVRKRLVSADLTASTCSSVACPSPGPADQPAFEMSLVEIPQLPSTIPEVIEGEDAAPSSLHCNVQVTYDDEDGPSEVQPREEGQDTEQ